MRLLAICLLGALVGCTTTRTITINSRPPGATIEIDQGAVRNRAPYTHQFVWEGDADLHNVTAKLPGYLDKTEQLRRDMERNEITIDLKPQTRRLNILVNYPAIIYVDGKALNTEPTAAITTPELDMEKSVTTNEWHKHEIKAVRDGFQPDAVIASWEDKIPVYNLTLKPMEKQLNVSTNPPGAAIYFDDETQPLGASPTREFPYDINKAEFFKHRLTAKLTGYPPAPLDISWDDGRTSYNIPLIPQSKSIKIHTEPPGGVVVIDGKELVRDNASGDSILPNLLFPPNSDGKPKIYKATITKEKTADREWHPYEATIAWQDGQSAYDFTLKEVRTRELQLLSVAIDRPDTKWEINPRWQKTIAATFTTEGRNVQIQKLTPPDVKGQSIDTLAISPDGKRLLFSVLIEKPQFRSQIYAVHLDGSNAIDTINDGQSLDVTPSFSPDGQQVLFSSDRFGSHLNIWAVSSTGATGAEQCTTGETTDLWPCMDSSPKPRIFCQTYIDRRNKPQLFSTLKGSNLGRDLRIDGGLQPRINPKNDAVIYSAYNEKTQKRDIFKVSDQGGMPTNITNSPDVDEYDAVWDRDGARIAFVSDKGIDPEEKLKNANIWTLDTSQPSAAPVQITTNPSMDDHPVWDPSGRAIYFRSNRGSEWGIWKIVLK